MRHPRAEEFGECGEGTTATVKHKQGNGVTTGWFYCRLTKHHAGPHHSGDHEWPQRPVYTVDEMVEIAEKNFRAGLAKGREEPAVEHEPPPFEADPHGGYIGDP